MEHRLGIALALVAALSVGPVVADRCEDTPSEAKSKLASLVAAVQSAEKQALEKAQKVKECTEALVAQYRLYMDARQKFQDIKKKEPKNGTDAEQVEHASWLLEKEKAEKARNDALIELDKRADELGMPKADNWLHSDKQRAQLIQSVYNGLPGHPQAPVDEIVKAFGCKEQIAGISGIPGVPNVKEVDPAEGGAMKAFDEKYAKVRKAREEMGDYEQKCGGMAQLAGDESATQGRDEDASSIWTRWLDRIKQMFAAARNAASQAGSNATTGGTQADLDTLATGTGSGTGPSPATGTGGDSGTVVSASEPTYTIQVGDFLWSIAEKLAASLGFPRLDGPDGLVMVLFRHIQGGNSGDPNLIFPGQIIDLQAVREDLAN